MDNVVCVCIFHSSEQMFDNNTGVLFRIMFKLNDFLIQFAAIKKLSDNDDFFGLCYKKFLEFENMGMSQAFQDIDLTSQHFIINVGFLNDFQSSSSAIYFRNAPKHFPPTSFANFV